MKNQFGKDYFGILEADPPFTLQLYDKDIRGQDEEESPTEVLWKSLYPNEPFLLDEQDNNNPSQSKLQSNSISSSLMSTSQSDESEGNSTNECTNECVRTVYGDEDSLLSGFDLLASTDRQATFLWQVSGPKFHDMKFLEDGVRNYYKFLCLRKHAPRQVIVPTYQIDLMWHTHILSNLSGYYKDCRAIMNSALHHDDSLNDRTDGGPLDVAFGQTTALWREQYGTEYTVEGGMYRGEPPNEYYNRDWGLYNRKDDINMAPVGRFLHLVGIHGASSTNPVSTVDGTESTVIVWCWKESTSRMWLHSGSEIIGDPSECWIRFDENNSRTLETVFQGSGGKGSCSVVAGGIPS